MNHVYVGGSWGFRVGRALGVPPSPCIRLRLCYYFYYYYHHLHSYYHHYFLLLSTSLLVVGRLSENSSIRLR